MRRHKIGRNDLCWCPSGKKFKNCHEGRAHSSRPTLQEILEKTREGYSKEYCLHPEASPLTCSGNIVRAHTIQRSRGLNLLARNGYVYGLAADYATLKKNKGIPDVRRVGIGSASTFAGFCGFHDNKTFEPIEKYPFQANQGHSFLLGYRAICKELFQKKAEKDLLPFKRALDRGKSENAQLWFQSQMDNHALGVIWGLRDVELYKSGYDKVLLSADCSEMKYYIIFSDQTPEFLCSGAAYIQSDFEGNNLQELVSPSTLLDLITFSVIAVDTGGAVVLGWLGESPVNMRFIRSLDSLPDHQLPHAIPRFSFEYFENVFMSPDWWDGLYDYTRKGLLRRVLSEAHPQMPRTDNCLAEDGIRAVKWSVTSRETNVRLRKLE